MSTTVDSTPMPQLPPSRIPATLPVISSATSCALVGLGLPDTLALGAAMGQPAARMRAAATGWDGIRTATVSSPAVTMSGTSSDRGTTMVRGPGQNVSIRARALAFNPLVKGYICSVSAICRISGLSAGRPLAANIFATAGPFSPSAPRPYTVSVGKATTSPAAIRPAASAMAASGFFFTSQNFVSMTLFPCAFQFIKKVFSPIPLWDCPA